jgi:hypothetical protein
MASDPTTERLRSLVAQITYLTTKGEIHWERQLDSLIVMHDGITIC